MSLELRLRKKGQLSEFSSKRRKLEAQADLLLISLMQKADSIADPADLDTEGLLQATTDLHAVCTTIRETDAAIKKLHDELYG